MSGRRASARSRNPGPVRAGVLLATAFTVLAGSVACGGGSPNPAGPLPPGRLTTSLQLAPVQPLDASQFDFSVGFAVSPATVLLGSYRADIRFDPARVQLVAVDPVLATTRLLNTGGAAAGTIIVAGASTQGFTDGLLFKATFLALGPGVTPADFTLVLSEAVDTRLRSLSS